MKKSFVVAIAVLLVGPFVYSSAAGASCQVWSERKVKLLMVDWWDTLSVTASAEILSVWKLPAGRSGVALPGKIGITNTAGLGTLFHETAHLIQMQEDGTVRFFLEYSSEWVRGLYSGCGPYDAYLAVGYEKQARSFAEQYVELFSPLNDHNVLAHEFFKFISTERAKLDKAKFSKTHLNYLTAALLHRKGLNVEAIALETSTLESEKVATSQILSMIP